MLALALGAALGASAPKGRPRDHSGILLPKSALDHGARKLAGKTGHRSQHPPKAKGKHTKSLVNGEDEHGPKWMARYGDSGDQRGAKQEAAKKLSQKQVPTPEELLPDPELMPELVKGADDPTIAKVAPSPDPEPEVDAVADAPPVAAADTGAEAAAAARAAASGANAPTAKVDDTEYTEADASGNTDMPLPAPAVCTGPGALAGDPACAVAKPEAADPTAAPAPCVAVMPSVSDEWCVSNCAIDNCPANMCDCSGGVKEEAEDDPNRPVCESIAPNVSDEWCQTNCEAWVRHEEGFFNCPPSQCKCTEHDSADSLGAAAGMGYMKVTPEVTPP